MTETTHADSPSQEPDYDQLLRANLGREPITVGTGEACRR